MGDATSVSTTRVILLSLTRAKTDRSINIKVSSYTQSLCLLPSVTTIFRPCLFRLSKKASSAFQGLNFSMSS